MRQLFLVTPALLFLSLSVSATDFHREIIRTVSNQYGPVRKMVDVKNVDVIETRTSVMGNSSKTLSLDVYVWAKGYYTAGEYFPNISIYDKNYPMRWSTISIVGGQPSFPRGSFAGIDHDNPEYSVFKIEGLPVPNDRFCVDLYALEKSENGTVFYSNQDNPNTFFTVCH